MTDQEQQEARAEAAASAQMLGCAMWIMALAAVTIIAVVVWW